MLIKFQCQNANLQNYNINEEKQKAKGNNTQNTAHCTKVIQGIKLN